LNDPDFDKGFYFFSLPSSLLWFSSMSVPYAEDADFMTDGIKSSNQTNLKSLSSSNDLLRITTSAFHELQGVHTQSLLLQTKLQ